MCSAGTDTSRVTLSIMIGLVVEHPEVQKKLHQELDDVLGDLIVPLKIWVDICMYSNSVDSKSSHNGVNDSETV